MIYNTEKAIKRITEAEKICRKSMGLLGNEADFSIYKQEKSKFNVYKFTTNVMIFGKLKSLISRFHTLIFHCEYFNKNIKIQNIGEIDFPDDFVDYIFISQLTDSLRSTLDLYSIFVMSFFNSKKSESISFSFKSFIKPMNKYSETIHIETNNYYKKYTKSISKEIRDRDRHLGFDQFSVNSKLNNDTTSFMINRNNYPKLSEVLNDTYNFIDDFISLFEKTIQELCK
jgi:hypothetical protein